MEIKNARFVISSSHVKDCPSHGLPEYAFIGRSNVGKSSLINMLTCKRVGDDLFYSGEDNAYQSFFGR